MLSGKTIPRTPSGFRNCKHLSMNNCSGGKAVRGEVVSKVVISYWLSILGSSIIALVPKGDL